MPRVLHVLVIDGSGRGLVALHQTLLRTGFEPKLTAVATLDRLRDALRERQWDLIIADDRVDGAPVLGALHVVEASGEDVPFIVMSGQLGEEHAIELMRAGANDYVMKDQLARLAPAVARELRDADSRREHRRAEEALRASEQRYRELFENARDMVFTLDLDGRFTSANRAAEALTGYSRDEALSLRLADLLPPEEFDARGLLASAGDPGAPRLVQLTVVSKDGRRIPVEISWHPIVRQGRVVGVEGIARDLTERRRLEIQLQHAQKMQAIGRLAGGIAHDFNNLLTAVSGYSELLIERLAADDPLRQTAEEIRNAASRAAGLTRQLLSFSRVQHVTTSLLDLNDVASEMERMLRRLIGEDVEFSCRVAERPLPVKADRGQLEQVLMNLVVNARDAMPQGGRLEVRTSGERVAAHDDSRYPGVAPGDWVQLEVQDTGCGMDAEVLSRLFEPFYTTKDPSRGTGLGLSTVYAIVTQAGGHVLVDSEPGRGARFRMLLPVAEQAAPPPPTRSTLSSLPRGDETVLLVEDESGVRELIRDFLARCGYHVLEAPDVQRALELFAAHRADIALLITDVVMPQMNGRMLAERLLATGARLKVLYISGYTDDLVLAQGIGSGAGFLQKPFTPLVLARKVREVLDGRAADPGEPARGSDPLEP